MKLARIILPERSNDRYMLTLVHSALRRRLIADYGGCTRTVGEGSWTNDEGETKHERVYIYDVAMERAAVTDFRSLAADIARDARQDCVMIVTPQGDVEFVKPKINPTQPLDHTADNSILTNQ